MKNLEQRFLTWYRQTHWMYLKEDLELSEGRFTNKVTQAIFVAYRAGFNRAIKEQKESKPLA